MVEKSHMSSFWPALYEPFRQMGTRIAEWVAPASEASSNADGYRISLELPGVNEDDIDLTIDDGVVTVRGEKKTERKEEGDTWYFTERQYGAFSRSFRVPPDADATGVTADLRDGVLTITLPKKSLQAQENTKRVPISRG